MLNRFCLIAAISTTACFAGFIGEPVVDFTTQLGQPLTTIDAFTAGGSDWCVMIYSGQFCPADMLMPQVEVDARQAYAEIVAGGNVPPEQALLMVQARFSFDPASDPAEAPEPRTFALVAAAGLLLYLYRSAHRNRTA